MFSGKSTELIRRYSCATTLHVLLLTYLLPTYERRIRLSRYQAAKVPLLLVKFAGDERFSSTEVQTHDRKAMGALAVTRLAEAREAARDLSLIHI